MTDFEGEQEEIQQEDRQPETKDNLRTALLNRVLDFVAPETKGTRKSAPKKDLEAPRKSSYFSQAVPKNRNPFNLSGSTRRMLGLILLAIAAIDLVAFSRIATNRFFTLAGNLMYCFRLDTLTYHLNTLVEIQVIISLIISAVLGGLLVYWFLKFTVYLSKATGLSVQRRHVTYVVGALTLFFFICFLVSICCGNGYATYETFHYLAPFLTYFCGLCMFGFSQLQFDI